MKKCASCSKDLPDAALHCVFCGAKQPPAPATSSGLAKTVMGSHSASDMIEHLRQQQPGGLPPRSVPGPTPGPSYGGPPRSVPGPTPGPSYGGPPRSAAGPTPGPSYDAPAPGLAPPAPSPFQRPAPASVPPPMGPPAGYGPGPGPMHPSAGPTLTGGPPGAGAQPPVPHGVPAVSAAAPTLYVPGPPAAAPGGPGDPPRQRPGPSQQPFSPAAGAFRPGGAAGPKPQPLPEGASSLAAARPLRPMPQQTPPYISAQANERSGHPVEPWRLSLRVHMIIWGVALLAVIAVPDSLDPLSFPWGVIIDGEGRQKLPPLIIGGVGLLSILLAVIPTAPLPRGLLAGLLGLVGTAHVYVLLEITEWKAIVPVAGMVLLFPGLLLREEYRESLLSRIMVTLGVIALLLPILVPMDSKLPIVDLFKAAIDSPGKERVIPLLRIAHIVLAILALLAWLPAPASGGAKVFAWLLLLWPGIMYLTELTLSEQIVDIATQRPNALTAIWLQQAAFFVLIAYGFATVIGKKLE